MDFEYLYILENENIPKLVKFGFTKNHPRERAKQLSADTGVPGRYKIIKFWRVTDGFKWEQYVFKRLSSYRKTGEFLKLTPQSAIDKIEIILTESEATSDYEKFELKESRRREKELFEEEHLKKRQEEWDKNLYKVERQATSEAEKRLGFTYLSIETQIDDDGTITFKGGKLKEKLIAKRMAEVKEMYPDYHGTDIDLRNEVVMDMKKTYGRIKFEKTGDINKPYTNDGVIQRKAKLEGIRSVKTSTIQTVEAKPEPVDPESPKSDETSTDESKIWQIIKTNCQVITNSHMMLQN